MGRRILVLLIGLALICGLVGCDQEPRMITVTFDANGATGDVPPSITVSCYDEIVVPTQGSLHKDGYYFTGWSSSRDNYAYYKSGDKKQFMHDELLYACWEEGCSDNVFGYSDETKTEIVYLCDRTATYYSIPYGVVKIGSRVFEGCSGISSIQIPDSVTEIEWNAFKGCTGLSELVLPSSIKKIGSDAFSSCNSLQIVFEEGITSIPDYALDCSYDDNGITSVKIPSTVVGIGTSAFSGCCGLTSIDLPYNLEKIGNYAFSGCKSLSSIRIPANVSSIGHSIFSGDEKLTSVAVQIGNSIYYSEGNCIIEKGDGFGKTLVAGCKNSEIPNDVTKIGDYSFEDCNGLTSIRIPESVESVGAYAFRGCSALSSITIPKSVKTMGGDVFSNCNKLEVVFEEGTQIIPNEALRCWMGGEGIASVVIPYSVTRIGNYAFRGCSGLTSITIPAGVTYIGDSAFYGCTGLTSITIPDSVTFIDDSAFGSCTGLASITIPEGVTGIGYRTFSYCSNLKRITIPKTITNIESWVFDECYNLVDIQYNSTIEDWNSISKDWDWDYGTPSFTIHCTDGDISK